jgi:hypothetical protein
MNNKLQTVGFATTQVMTRVESHYHGALLRCIYSRDEAGGGGESTAHVKISLVYLKQIFFPCTTTNAILSTCSSVLLNQALRYI